MFCSNSIRFHCFQRDQYHERHHSIDSTLTQILSVNETLRAHLYPATETRLRHRCDIAPEFVTKRFPSDSKTSRSHSHKRSV